VENQPIKTSLRDYFRILCYWKGTVIVLFLVISLTALVGSFLLPPVYEAFTLVLVERGSRMPLLHKDYATAGIPPQLSVAEERTELAKTQSEIMKSRHILERVVLEFEFDKNFEDPNKIEKAIDSLQSRIDVELEEGSSIIKLSVKDNDPELAAKIANTIADNYVNWISEIKMSKTKGASGALTERVAILDDELKEAETRLDQLKKQGDVTALKEEIETTVAKLADFDSEYNHAIADIEEQKVRFREIEANLKQPQENLIAVTQIITNSVIETLTLKLLDLELKRTKLVSRYNEGSMPLESVDEEIAQTKTELRNEIKNVSRALINSIKTDLSALQARKEALEEIRDKYSTRLRQLSDVALEYKRLERQVKGKNELYVTLLGKQAEASLVEVLKSGLLVNVRIIDPAKVPVKPVSPKKVLNTILGCIVGLISGIGGAFVKEYWDHSLKTIDEVEHYMGLSTLAAIPRAKGKSFTLYTPGSPISENFHTLSTGIQQLCKERGINILLVTSANNREGKSVVCANLAASLASIEGKRVLAIDANLRVPTLHKFFEVNIKSNLLDVLSQEKTIQPDPTDIRNLSLISTTQEVSEPSRFLASDSLKGFIKKVKAEYDYVIIDSPALIKYPDASILGFESEGIILVAKFGETKREVLERARSLLDKSQRKILGVVLNNVEYVIPERLYKRL